MVTSHVSPLPLPNRACDFHRTRLSRDWPFLPGITPWVVMFIAFTAASTVLRDHRLTSDSGSPRQLIDQNNVNPLPPFPLYVAFPRAEYYGGSDAPMVHCGTVPLRIGASHVHGGRLTIYFRWWLTLDPSRSLRNPDWNRGNLGSTVHPLGWQEISTSLGGHPYWASQSLPRRPGFPRQVCRI